MYCHIFIPPVVRALCLHLVYRIMQGEPCWQPCRP